MHLFSFTYPGFGYLFSLRATTVWETWERDTPNVSVRSCNHPMKGGNDAWFYSHLAGIRLDKNYAGFKKIIIKPNIIGGLTYVKGEYESMYGTISSNWKIINNNLELHICIPPNTSALVYIPTKNSSGILENGKPLEEGEGVEIIEFSDNMTICQIGSGKYKFVSPWSK